MHQVREAKILKILVETLNITELDEIHKNNENAQTMVADRVRTWSVLFAPKFEKKSIYKIQGPL